MTVRYCSDLHLEFRDNKEYLKRNPIEPGADVLILAGDIIPFAEIDKQNDFLDYVSDNFEVTYWIPGNHEYYYCDLAKRTGSFQIGIRENIFIVNNKAVNLGGVRFVFSTLWTYISPPFENIIRASLYDFEVIGFEGERLTTSLYNKQHLDCLNFIKDEFQMIDDNTIVVTHHVPTKLNYPEIYRSSKINEAFAVELFDIIESSGAEYWLYGHHHFNTPEFTIGKTKLVTNQIGYVQNEEHLSFNPGALIEL